MSTNPPLSDHHPDDDLPRNAPGARPFVFDKGTTHVEMANSLRDMAAANGWFLGTQFGVDEAQRRLALFRSRLTSDEQEDYVHEVADMPAPERAERVLKEWAA